MQYGIELFALAVIRFNNKGDVILYQSYEDHYKLKNGTKFDPHVTYHADGTYHVAHYKGNPIDKGYLVNRKRQPLSSSFKGIENLIVQGFQKHHAKILGDHCKNYDRIITINADDIGEKVEALRDNLGEFETHYILSSFQVDLLEPGFDPSIIPRPEDLLRSEHERVLVSELIKETLPWCLITVRTQVA